MTKKRVTLSCSGTLPTVTFLNTSTGEHATWICEDHTLLDEAVDHLASQPHVEVVHVCRTSRVQTEESWAPSREARS